MRCYERALRRDGDSPAIVPAVLAAALRLKRYDEAVRYVLLPRKLDGADPLQLRELGVHLTEQSDFARAVAVYEKALAACNRPPLDIVLRKELGDLCLATENYKRAAECFAKLLDAVEHPEKHGLDEQVKGIGGRSPTNSSASAFWRPIGRKTRKRRSRRPRNSHPTRRCGSSTSPACV